MKPLAALALASCLLASCAECIRQEHRACTCANGGRGEQFCTEEKTFGPCICAQSTARDGGSDVVSADR